MYLVGTKDPIEELLIKLSTLGVTDLLDLVGELALLVLLHLLVGHVVKVEERLELRLLTAKGLIGIEDYDAVLGGVLKLRLLLFIGHKVHIDRGTVELNTSLARRVSVKLCQCTGYERIGDNVVSVDKLGIGPLELLHLLGYLSIVHGGLVVGKGVLAAENVVAQGGDQCQVEGDGHLILQKLISLVELLWHNRLTDGL